VLAATAALLLLGRLALPPSTSSIGARAVVVAGFVAFFGAGLLFMAGPRAFLEYPPALAKPLIVTIETVLTISIAATLALLIAGPPSAPPAGHGR
jgi:hypothetical protein